MESSAKPGRVLRSPSQEASEHSLMWQFARATVPHHHAADGDYEALHAWSIGDPDNYHASLWDFLQIIGERGERSVHHAERLRDVRFFPDARLNYAENLLRDPDERVALIACREDGTERRLTRAQLTDQVSRMAQALRAAGVGVGDRVAAIITNDAEAAIAMLAVASLGAIWASCSPDFGAVSAVDRLAQITPKVLFAVTHYRYGGKHFDISATLRALSGCPTIERLILIDDNVPAALADLPCQTWQDFVAPYRPAAIDFVRLPFAAPLAILFSSGTTGKPKGIIHSAGGLLLQHLKELKLHCDLRAGEKLLYFTTCGWMMWNWQISALALGVTLVTFDGNPGFPTLDSLPALLKREAIEVFGTSARYLDACAKAGIRPQQTQPLATLRLLLSTGSPLLPAGFEYVYSHWSANTDLASISGGTDICGCFLGGNPLLPVRSGELKCAMLGMDVDVVDDACQRVFDTPGELICRNAHLSMPVGFWDDADGSRYHRAYFDRFDNVWVHGDFATHCREGGYLIHGRSDTTLNPGGVRIGTAEIYRQVEAIAAIDEAVVVAQELGSDQRVILFVKLKPGAALDAALEKNIRDQIRAGATPRHVPDRILAVPELPRTHSGKLSEVAVRDAIHGRTVSNRQALANPQVLEYFKPLA